MRLSINWTGMWVHASHYVDPDQREPGLPLEAQSDQHLVDFTMWTMRLGWAVAVTEHLEFELELPLRRTVSDATFLDENGAELSDFSSIHHRDETIQGVGDLALKGRYRLVRPESQLGWLLDATFGVTVPTGGIEENPFELGRRGLSHQHIFFGTGTFDPLLGLESRYAYEDFAFRFDFDWRGSLYENEESFKGPNTFVLRTSVESNVGFETLTFRAGVEFLEEYPAKWSGETAKNSGRRDVSPLVGMAWAATEAWSSFILLKRPFILDVSGGQLEMPLIGAFGASYAFEGW